MGWWKLEKEGLSAWKQADKGNDAKLTDIDIEHIAQQVREGYIQGEVV